MVVALVLEEEEDVLVQFNQEHNKLQFNNRPTSMHSIWTKTNVLAARDMAIGHRNVPHTGKVIKVDIVVGTVEDAVRKEDEVAGLAAMEEGTLVL